MKKFTTKLLVTMFDFFSKNFRKVKKVDKDILIIFGGVIGDSILFSDSLRGYRELFPLNKGYNISICAPNSAAIVLEKYTEEFNTIGIDFKKLNTDFEYHKKIINKVANKMYILAINPFIAHSDEADSIMINCKARRKIQVVSEEKQKLNILEKIINKNCGEKITIAEDLMELQKYAEVVRKLGCEDFKAKVPRLKEYHEYYNFNFLKYVVLAVGGSTPCKRWNEKHFANIANYIIKLYDIDVVICGGNNEAGIFENMKIGLEFPDKVHNYIGKTSLFELIELIRNSCLVVGNDSSSVHIAAAVNTPSACIVGGWDYGRMYPYKVDIICENEILPKPIYHYMECFNCAKVLIGYNNDNCKEKIKHLQQYPCIDCISEYEVCEAIKELIEN